MPQSVAFLSFLGVQVCYFKCSSSSQLSVRAKNTREKLGSFFKGFSKTFDDSVLLKGHKDVDTWFEAEKKFLVEYHAK